MTTKSNDATPTSADLVKLIDDAGVALTELHQQARGNDYADELEVSGGNRYARIVRVTHRRKANLDARRVTEGSRHG